MKQLAEALTFTCQHLRAPTESASPENTNVNAFLRTRTGLRAAARLLFTASMMSTTRSPSEKYDFIGSIEQKSSIMSHGQKLPAVPTGSGVSASPEPAGLAAGKPFGVLRQRRDRQPEWVRLGRGVWRGAARAAAVRSADDDQTTGLWILRGRVQFAAHPTTFGRGHCVSCAGGGQRAELSHHLGFPQNPSAYTGKPVRTDTAEGAGRGCDEVGAGGVGWHESKGQCPQAQGDEL